MATSVQVSCSVLTKAYYPLSDNRRIFSNNNPNSSISFSYSKTLNRALSFVPIPISKRRLDVSFSGGAGRGGDWSRGDEDEEFKPSSFLFNSSKSAGFFGRRLKVKHSIGGVEHSAVHRAQPNSAEIIEATKRLVADYFAYGVFKLDIIENNGTSVLAGPNQHYSNTYKLMAETAEILNITTPLLYIRSNDSLVPRTVGLDTPYIVIHPSLIERLTPQELQVVFAHELAHLKCGHYALLKLMHILVFMAEELPDCVGRPLKELFHWGQAMELSCDRASLLVAQDPKVVISAIMKLAGGIRSMVQERDVDAYLTSARAYVYIRSSSPTGVFGDACTRNPVPLLRAYEIDEWSRSKDYAMLLTSATTQGEAFIKKKITEKVSATTQGEALTKKKINEKVLEQFDMKKIIQNLLEQVYMAKNEKIIEKLLKQVDIGKIKKLYVVGLNKDMETKDPTGACKGDYVCCLK